MWLDEFLEGLKQAGLVNKGHKFGLKKNPAIRVNGVNFPVDCIKYNAVDVQDPGIIIITVPGLIKKREAEKIKVPTLVNVIRGEIKKVIKESAIYIGDDRDGEDDDD